MTYIAKAVIVSKYIHNLILQGEHQQLDFKFEITDSRRIARSLTAFANTDGGILLIGVKDNGALAGVRSDEEIFMVEAAANLYSKPEIKMKTREWVVNKKTILEVSVVPVKKHLHYARDKNNRWKVYIRVKDQNLMVNKIWLKAWERKHAARDVFLPYTDTENILLKYLEKNPSITLTKFTKIAGVSRRKAEDSLIRLVSMKIIDIQFTDKIIYYRLNTDDNPPHHFT